MTTATVLTAIGTGAIATIEFRGPDARTIAARHFSKSLPAVGEFRFGTFLQDEIVLAVIDDDVIELHVHGGRGVIDMMLSELKLPSRDIELVVERAPTLRTAAILLTHRESERNVKGLIDPWIVAIVGPPNVGKSSLLNAIAGFDRAIVSPIPGTTRDAVRMTVALDGWPVELIDTAGLRDTTDALEAGGMERTRQAIETADLVVAVMDASNPSLPDVRAAIVVANKTDLPHEPLPKGVIGVSAKAGTGVAALVGAIVRVLVPNPPDAEPLADDARGPTRR